MSNPSLNGVVPRALLDSFARQVDPRGLSALPALGAMALGLDEVPPDFERVASWLAVDGPEVEIEIRVGGETVGRLVIR